MMARIWKGLTRNVAETAPNHEDRRLRTRFYRALPEVVFRAAEKTAEGLDRWRIVAADPVRGDIRAECQTRLFGFVDDLEVEIRDTGEGRTAVNVRSASRVGKGDLGQNARNVARLLEALDGKLA